MGSLADQGQSDNDQSSTTGTAGGRGGAVSISATPSTDTVTGIAGNTPTANGTS